MSIQHGGAEGLGLVASETCLGRVLAVEGSQARIGLTYPLPGGPDRPTVGKFVAIKGHGYGWSCWHVPRSRVVHLGGQTTGTGASGSPHKRMPRTWFDSRARYFAKNHGIAYALATDAAAVASRLVGAAKRALTRKSWDATPHYTRDLVRSSAWWPANRVIPPASRDVASRASRSKKKV
jgi:hypothetical protein